MSRGRQTSSQRLAASSGHSSGEFLQPSASQLLTATLPQLHTQLQVLA